FSSLAERCGGTRHANFFMSITRDRQGAVCSSQRIMKGVPETGKMGLLKGGISKGERKKKRQAALCL
ncbi:hypothetical protein BaRGS_00028829, partial [Batillaria attramentaria]